MKKYIHKAYSTNNGVEIVNIDHGVTIQIFETEEELNEFINQLVIAGKEKFKNEKDKRTRN